MRNLKATDNKRAQVLLAILSVAWIGMTSKAILLPDRTFNLIQAHISQWASLISTRQIPWVGFPAEYPPLGVYFLAWPGILGLHRNAASWVLAASIASLAVTSLTIWMILKHRVRDVGRLWFAVNCSVLLLLLSFQKETWLLWNDTVPTLLCIVLTIVLLKTTRREIAFLAAFALTAIALSKIYLIAIVVMLLAMIYRRKDINYIFTVGGVVLSLLCFLGFALKFRESTEYFLHYHMGRKIEVGSIYAPILSLLSQHPISTKWFGGSFELSESIPFLSVISTVPPVLFIVATAYLSRLANSRQQDMGPEIFCLASCGAMSAFFGLNKVGSANYALVPILLFFGFLSTRHEIRSRVWQFYALFAVVIVSTRFTLPSWTLTPDFRSVGNLPLLAILFKNLSFLAISLLSMKWLYILSCPRATAKEFSRETSDV